MYTFTKSHTFEDTIALEADGEREELHIALDITPELVHDFRALRIELMNLDKEDKTEPSIIEKVEKAVCSMLTLLLGKENSEKIFAFYNNDPVKTLSVVFPYMQEKIIPELEKSVKSYKKTFKKKRW